jgi:4-diphosphocytidyl-2-C-methyl-D-erythritol kinase
VERPVSAGLQLRSYAKVNLGLEVLGLRQDGYHELRTIFQTIDLHDVITLRPRRDGELRVRCAHPDVPNDERNLALRAAQELRRYAGLRHGLAIEIDKRIPVAGGLGGGSSNAATVLLGLDRLWRLGLGPAGLHPLARRLGADVPYFLVGGTALGVARGEEVYPLHHQLRARVVVVDPQRPLSTAAVFRRIDAELTPRENSTSIFRFVSSDLNGAPAFAALRNDLEQAALQEAPELRRSLARIRGMLMEAGARMAALSGSGATFFGLFDDADRGAARRAHVTLLAAGYKALRARTVSLDRYRRGWSALLGRPGRGAGRGR